MQPRDRSRLERDQFDLLVVGGGIQGLAIAYDAASRGLRTALIEASDFGSGISFNHQKTVHGGLRSLQSLRLDRAREGIRERRAFGRIAPWLLRPMPFVMGTYRSLAQGRTAVRAGFAADRWLGWHRNAGVERELHLPPPRLLSRGLTLKLFPGIREEGLTGGAQWYDYQMVENDRLTFAFAAAADRAGAVLVNEVEATGVLRDGGRVAGVEARDAETGARIDIRAALTVNAAGAGAEALMRQFGVPRSVPLLAAMNLVIRREGREIALAAPTRGGRMLTLVPWRGQAIVGTGHSDRLVPADARTPAPTEIDELVADANEAFPALRLTRDDVTLVHRGLVPAAVGRRGPGLLATPRILDHADEGAPGAMTVIGVKYTTARGVAEAAVGVAARRLGRFVAPSPTGTTPLPGAALADHEGVAIETARTRGLDLPADVLRRLSALYAERAAGIIASIADRPELAARLDPSQAIVGAEVVHAIRHEMARHLADIVLRRTTVGAAGHPGAAIVEGCARLAAAECGWTPARTAEEIAALERTYRVP